MNKYIFFLGNHPEISISEIKCLMRFLGISATYQSLTREVLIVNTSDDVNVRDILKRLGGTVKIAKIIYEDIYVSVKKIFEICKNEDKIRVGISSYDNNIDKRKITNYLIELKKIAKGAGKKINFILPKDNFALSSAQVYHKILPKGYEINILRSGNNYIFAKTLAVQDVNTLSKLDYGIPSSQKKSGMLPPKLAQMMINLSLPSNPAKVTIYDPFCGTGRVIIQGLYIGLMDIYGSDINQEAIEKTKKNIIWLKDNYKIDIDDQWINEHIFAKDAQEKNVKINKKIQSIVCEPDLGKPHKFMPEQNTIEEEFARLEKLYIESLKALRDILDKEAKLVIIFPKIGEMSLYDKLVDKIEALGYHMKRNFIYARDYQIVKRHICVFNFMSK